MKQGRESLTATNEFLENLIFSTSFFSNLTWPGVLWHTRLFGKINFVRETCQKCANKNYCEVGVPQAKKDWPPLVLFVQNDHTDKSWSWKWRFSKTSIFNLLLTSCRKILTKKFEFRWDFQRSLTMNSSHLIYSSFSCIIFCHDILQTMIEPTF